MITANGIINFLKRNRFKTTFIIIMLKRFIEEYRGTLRKREINDIRKDKSNKNTKRRRVMTQEEINKEEGDEDEKEEDRKKGKKGGHGKRRTQKQK